MNSRVGLSVRLVLFQPLRAERLIRVSTLDDFFFTTGGSDAHGGDGQDHRNGLYQGASAVIGGPACATVAAKTNNSPVQGAMAEHFILDILNATRSSTPAALSRNFPDRVSRAISSGCDS